MAHKAQALTIRFVPPSKEYIKRVTQWKEKLQRTYCCPYCDGDIDIHVQPGDEGLFVEPNLIFMWRCPVKDCVWHTWDDLNDWWAYQKPRNRGGETMVIFRVWDICAVTVALFPCTRGESKDIDAFTYIDRSFHINYAKVINETRPARPEEARVLADELKAMGYNLTIRKRAPSDRFKWKWLAMGND